MANTRHHPTHVLDGLTPPAATVSGAYSAPPPPPPPSGNTVPYTYNSYFYINSEVTFNGVACTDIILDTGNAVGFEMLPAFATECGAVEGTPIEVGGGTTGTAYDTTANVVFAGATYNNMSGIIYSGFSFNGLGLSFFTTEVSTLTFDFTNSTITIVPK